MNMLCLIHLSLKPSVWNHSWFRLSHQSVFVWSPITIKKTDETTWTLLWKAERRLSACLCASAAKKPQINNSDWFQSHQVSRSFPPGKHWIVISRDEVTVWAERGEKALTKRDVCCPCGEDRVNLKLSGWQQDQYQLDMDINVCSMSLTLEVWDG